MRFDEQFRHQLMSIAHPDLHGAKTALREIFIVIAPSAPHARTGDGKGYARNDYKVYIDRIAGSRHRWAGCYDRSLHAG